jgi:preprotein translocase SecE subunit
MKAKEPKKAVIGKQPKQAKDTNVLKKRGYLAESVVELKKVSFPSREETFKTSVWTLAFVLFFSAVLAIFDLCFQNLMKFLVGL